MFIYFIWSPALICIDTHVAYFYVKCNAMHFAYCYRRACLCVCLCVCVYVTFVYARKTVWDRDVVFFKFCEITPDIISKSLTQIRLQIPRWRTKWRPWNTIICCNSAIYQYSEFVFSLNCAYWQRTSAVQGWQIYYKFQDGEQNGAGETL